MNFRYARHTNQLSPIIEFYTKVMGLEILGDFANHSDYDGVFLGLKDKDWHLEFTTSKMEANHQFDEDDLLVFYVESQIEMDEITSKATGFEIDQVEPKNPYWKSNGITFLDPDGFRVVVSIKKSIE